MSLRVLALGTGVCSDTPHTKKARQPPGFLISINEELHLLFDCSEGIRFRCVASGVLPSAITHVFITHSHPDHVALPQFIQSKFCYFLFDNQHHDPRATELNVYMPQLLARDFPQVWNWHQPENDGGYWNEFEPKIIGMKDGYTVQIAEGVRLHAVNLYHGYGRHPAMGFRLETPDGILAYTGDCGVCDGVNVIAKDADLLIADCSTRVGQEYTGGYGHMGPKQCGDFALKNNVKELWLTHYFDLDAPEAMLGEVRAAGFFGKSIVATDGLEWKK